MRSRVRLADLVSPRPIHLTPDDGVYCPKCGRLVRRRSHVVTVAPGRGVGVGVLSPSLYQLRTPGFMRCDACAVDFSVCWAESRGVAWFFTLEAHGAYVLLAGLPVFGADWGMFSLAGLSLTCLHCAGEVRKSSSGSLSDDAPVYRCFGRCGWSVQVPGCNPYAVGDYYMTPMPEDADASG